MIYLSQRDPRWANLHIGASMLQMWRFGCTTTALSMLSDYFGQFMPPNVICGHKDWYTGAGLVLWQKLKIPRMQFVERVYGYNKAKILASLKDTNGGVLLQVSNGQHWIVAVRKTWLKDDFLCVDPWTGKACSALGDYSNITGSAHFKKF